MLNRIYSPLLKTIKLTVLAVVIGTVSLLLVSEGPARDVANADPGGCNQIRDRFEEIEREKQGIQEMRASLSRTQGIYQAALDRIGQVLERGTASNAAREALLRNVGEIEGGMRAIATQARQIDQNEALINEDLERALQQWISNDCGPPPPGVCATVSANDSVPARSDHTSNRTSRDQARTDAAGVMADMTRPIGPPIYGRIHADGTITSLTSESPEPLSDPRTGVPYTLGPNTFHEDERVIVGRYDIQRRDGGGTISTIRVTGEHGQSGVPGAPGYEGNPYSTTAGYLGATWVLPNSSSSPGAARALPLATFAVGVVVISARVLGPRLMLTLEALFIGFRAIDDADRASRRPPLEARRYLRRCGFHVELEVASGDMFAGRMPSAAVRAADAAEPPPSSTPSPTPTPPDDGIEIPSGGSGPGKVHYVGNNCGRVNGRWSFQTFIGETEKGTGFGVDWTATTGADGRARNITNATAAIFTLDTREVDWNRREIRDWWNSYKAQLKARITADLSRITTRLRDPDGIGDGNLGYLVVKHPDGRALRFRIKPGCHQPAPRFYSNQDAP